MKYLRHLSILVTLSILLAISGCSNKVENNNINSRSRTLDNMIDEKTMSVMIGDYTFQDYKLLLDDLSIYKSGEMYSIIDVEDGSNNTSKKYYIPLLFKASNFDIKMIDNLKISICINETDFTEATIEDNIENIFILKFDYSKDIESIKIIIGLKEEFSSLYNITHEYIINELDDSLLNMAPYGYLENNKVTYIGDSTFILTDYNKIETEIIIDEQLFKQYQLLITLNGWGSGYNSLNIPSNIKYSIIDNEGNEISLPDIDTKILEYDKVYMQTEMASGKNIIISIYCPIKSNEDIDKEYARNILQEFILNNKIKFKIHDKVLLLKMDTVELSD